MRVAFAITDTAGGLPLAKVYPSAWAVPPSGTHRPCRSRDALLRAQALINGGLFNRPEPDLNIYYAVTLNHNATITVVDPLFGFGGTKLLALVPLAARGDDWALGPGGRQIFVAMPDANQVAIVDTSVVEGDGERAGRNPPPPPGRTAGRPIPLDRRRVQPGHPDSGVTVLKIDQGTLAARIRTAPGRHDLALSDDSRHAFVTNDESGSVSIIDAEALRRVVTTIPTGRRPTSIAYSTPARQAYVTDAVDGTITGIDPRVAGGRAIGSRPSPASARSASVPRGRRVRP